MANKKNNSAKYIKIVVALVLIIAAAFGIYYMFFESYRIVDKDNTAGTVNTTDSESFVSESASAKKDMQSTVSETEVQSKPEESKANTTANQEKNYNLPLSINQAMNALEERYGAEYDVNSTIEEDGINYFAVYKNDEKYASVAVNLMTGEATETITETNQKTDFYLV